MQPDYKQKYLELLEKYTTLLEDERKPVVIEGLEDTLLSKDQVSRLFDTYLGL